jgi:hypothetical protein
LTTAGIACIGGFGLDHADLGVGLFSSDRAKAFEVSGIGVAL